MLEGRDRAHTMREANRRWPHEHESGEVTSTARAVRRLTFRQGVEWALEEIAAGRIDRPEPTDPKPVSDL